MVEQVDISKDSLRNFALSKRNEIKDKELKESIIINKLLKNNNILKSKDILVYVSKDLEVSTINLILEFLKINKNVYVPKVINENLVFYKLNNLSELKLGKFKVLEPTSNIKYIENNNSSIIVPGLLFDKKFNRLGYGGGYFDRYLNNKNIYKIGICFKEFLIDELPINSYDIKMDLVITEE